MKQRRAIESMVLTAAMTAILEAAKFALNAIPNVELITLLLIVYTVVLGWKTALKSALLFAGIESLWWGISMWTVTYFYVWPILVLLAWVTRDIRAVIAKALLAGIFGLLFGMLCALPTLFTAGLHAAIAWWISGIPYDLIHGVSNFLLCLFLYRPLATALEHIRNRTNASI